MDGLERALGAFAAANGLPPTPAQIARLAALARQFDGAARQHHPAASGVGWVYAAIQEAVESGSHFVAPRRIARICERWAAEGGPGGVRGEALPEPHPAEAAGVLGRMVQGIVGGERRVSDPIDEEESADLIDDPYLAREEGLDPARGPNARPAPASFPELGLPGRAVWQAVCDEARRRVTAPGDAALLTGSRLVGREMHTLIIGVPGRSAAQRAQVRLAQTLADVTRVVLGRSFDLRFVSLAEWSAGSE